jgi:hypothetical protein
MTINPDLVFGNEQAVADVKYKYRMTLGINHWAKLEGSCSLDRSSRVVPRRVRSDVKLSGFIICFGWTTGRATPRIGCDESQRIYGALILDGGPFGYGSKYENWSEW